MKKIISILLALMLAATLLSACGKKAEPEAPAAQTEAVEYEEASEEKAGGWTINEEPGSSVSDEMMEIFNKAMDGLTGQSFVPVAHIATQVVAGTNHMFLCQGTLVTAKPVTAWKVVTVYENLDGDCELLNIADFDYTENWGRDTESKGAEAIPGGWTVAEDLNEVTLPKEAKDAFEEVTNGLAGASYQPVALLGTQLVSGINYAILCKESYVVPNAVPFLSVMYIYVPLSGKAEITNIAAVDLKAFTK